MADIIEEETFETVRIAKPSGIIRLKHVLAWVAQCLNDYRALPRSPLGWAWIHLSDPPQDEDPCAIAGWLLEAFDHHSGDYLLTDFEGVRAAISSIVEEDANHLEHGGERRDLDDIRRELDTPELRELWQMLRREVDTARTLKRLVGAAWQALFRDLRSARLTTTALTDSFDSQVDAMVFNTAAPMRPALLRPFDGDRQRRLTITQLTSPDPTRSAIELGDPLHLPEIIRDDEDATAWGEFEILGKRKSVQRGDFLLDDVRLRASDVLRLWPAKKRSEISRGRILKEFRKRWDAGERYQSRRQWVLALAEHLKTEPSNCTTPSHRTIRRYLEQEFESRKIRGRPFGEQDGQSK